MFPSEPKMRLRYPFHAVLLVAVCWLFYGVVLLLSSLLILPCVPLAPALVLLMLGLGGLLSSVHEYARSVATPMQPATLRPLAEVAEISTAAARAPQHG